MFSEQEWEDFQCTNESELLEDLNFPGKAQFVLPELQTPEDRNCVCDQRTYGPSYGRQIFEDNFCSCWCHTNGPVFVKQGWGTWIVIEFNDGEGGRTRRRFFQHDHADRSFINHVADTISPFIFSDSNFKKLRIWNAQPIEMSWFQIRRQAIPTEDMIAALEDDLKMLKGAEPLQEEDFQNRVSDYLQGYTHPIEDREAWREGTCTYPRLDDGTVDKDEFYGCYPSLKSSAVESKPD
jgi:hypothetical protein